ncbi:MAG: HAMP domain-containing protein [Candidatus Zixiibacteriota bacterium]|nr:MAG: HAMP domain-containing protein [candidate division Zixibacteria bacterium]
MKIRSRLLLIYGVMLVLLLLVGSFSLRSILELGKAADELSAIYDQSIRAEQLRFNTQRQINYSLDFLLGETDANVEFEKIQTDVQSLFEELKVNSNEAVEGDLIESLEETQYELVWLMNRYFERGQNSLSDLDLPDARARLREIGDEVSDDVVTLNRYYSRLQSRKLSAASRAGKTVAWVVGATAALALMQFIALVMLSQRWLVKPIGDLNRAAAAISGGDLDTHIEFPGRNEWGQLADSINMMTSSLKDSLQKLAAHERTAALGELAAYASHNIRNPLAGIRAAAQVIVDDRKPVDVETSESLQEIIETIDRLDNWLKRLLEYAKPLQPQIETADINRLAKESADIVGKLYPDKNVRLKWNLSENLPALQIDSILIEQALMTIVTNAYEAVERDGAISIETALSSDGEDRNFVEIIISDNGKGVPVEIHPKLFRAFMTSKEGGTGLGLAQAKKVVDIHGGEINLESSPGRGTTVTIKLPVHTVAG